MLRILTNHLLLASGVLLFSGGMAAAQGASATCELNGVVAFNKARAAGYVFKVEASTAKDCELYRDTSTIIVSAKKDVGGVCQYRIFADRPLRAGWTFTGFELSGSQVSIAVLPTQATGGQGRLLSIVVAAGQTKGVSVTAVKLKGGSCDEAEEAFG